MDNKNNNFFSLYNSTKDFFEDKELLQPYIDKIIDSLKSTTTSDDLDAVYSACVNQAIQLIENNLSIAPLAKDTFLLHLFFKSCAHNALITFYTLLTNNLRVPAGLAFKKYLTTYKPIRITISDKKLFHPITRTCSLEKIETLPDKNYRTKKKRAFDTAHAKFNNLIPTNDVEYLYLPTINSSLYLACEYSSQTNGLPKFFHLLNDLENDFNEYIKIQEKLSHAYEMLANKHGINDALSYFFTSNEQIRLQKQIEDFYALVPNSTPDKPINWNNHSSSYNTILQHLFEYNDKEFNKALQLLSLDSYPYGLAKNIHSRFYPKYCKFQKLLFFLEQLQNVKKQETLSLLETLLRDYTELNEYPEFSALKELLTEIIFLETKHADLIKKMTPVVLQALTEYYCSYYSNASIDSFTLYSPGNEQRTLTELCDYIQNLQLRKYVFATDLLDIGLQYYQSPNITISPEQMNQFLSKFSIPFPRGIILNHVLNQYCFTRSSQEIESSLSALFMHFYPTLTRLFLGVLYELVNTDSNIQKTFRECCITIAEHCETALSKQLFELKYPVNDQDSDDTSNKKLGPPEVTVTHNFNLHKRDITTKDHDSSSNSTTDESNPIDSPKYKTFIEYEGPFMSYLNKIFMDFCPDNYVSATDKFLPNTFGESEPSKAAQQSKWINTIRNQSNHLSTQKLSICLDIAKYPKLPINATWTVMMADILTTFLSISHPDKCIADLPKDALSNTTK